MSFLKLLTLALTAAALPSHLSTRQAPDISAFDISAAQPPNFFQCMKDQGFSKVVIRGWQQACGAGGQIDNNFLPSYQAAKAAGLGVDSYLFPCQGDQPTGVPCKPVQAQIDEYIKFMADNQMVVDTLWFDLEPSEGECVAWTGDKKVNEDEARRWVAAMMATNRPWGIYANANQWTSMFATRETDIGSGLPFWAVQADDQPGVGTVTEFAGGWTAAVGKQYTLDTAHPVCGGSIDLNSFVAPAPPAPPAAAKN